jgi:hypothetical protein
MSFDEIKPTKNEIIEYYEMFLELGYFHNDQSRIHEKSFVKLTSFFEKEFSKLNGSDIELLIGVTDIREWGTVVWYCDANLDYNNIENEIKEYMKIKIAQSNF